MSNISVTIGDHTYTVEVHIQPAGEDLDLTAIVDGEAVKVSALSPNSPEAIEWIAIDHRSYEIVIDHDLRWIQSRSGRHRLEIRDLEAAVARPSSADARVKAPIPGMIMRVLVAAGDRVEAGQPLLVLEAMKMENEIRAPRSGVVGHINVGAGQSVTLHEVLAEIA
jgi:biotin carboxyl carrier protein